MRTGFRSHRFFLVLLGALLLLVAGCQQFGGKTSTQPTTDKTFLGGSQGLVFAFAEDQPPLSVLDGGEEQFFITLRMKNEGEYTIPTGGVIASLSGIVKDSFKISSMDKKSDVEIVGKSKETGTAIPGGEELLEFGSAGFQAKLPGSTSFTLRADACYTYQTLAVAKICLKKNVLQKEVGQVCDTSAATVPAENSGAPMHIANVRQSTVGTSKVRVTFQITNDGQGQVYSKDTFKTSCVGMEDKAAFVDVKVSNPDNNYKIECSQLGNRDGGTVKLITNKKDISCTIDTSGLPETTVQDVFIVELNYQYREAIATALAVTNVR